MKPFSLASLASRARAHWTPDRLQRLMAGKRLPLHPVTHAAFLHATGLMSDDASVTSGQVKKFLQINHMITLIAPPFRALAKAMPGRTLTLLDAGCGNSWLSLAFAFLAREAKAGRLPQIPEWKDTAFDLQVIGVDTNELVIRQSRERAALLGLEDTMGFQCVPLAEAGLPDRLHAVMALHACDTATDDALVLGLRRGADLLAVAPCCQAELARHFKAQAAAGPEDGRVPPLDVLLHSANLRRDAAATFTDALRLALVRALGYEATATEFIPSAHTPKNRLILAERRGRYNKAGLASFLAMKQTCGGAELALERGVKDLLTERFPATPAEGTGAAAAE